MPQACCFDKRVALHLLRGHQVVEDHAALRSLQFDCLVGLAVHGPLLRRALKFEVRAWIVAFDVVYIYLHMVGSGKSRIR